MDDKTFPIECIATGMVTAAGCNARATVAAIRAKVSGIQQGNIWDPLAGEYLEVGRPCMPQWWEGPDMLAELAVPAVVECLEALSIEKQREDVPIFILVSPLDRPFRSPNLNDIVCDEFLSRFPFVPSEKPIVVARGRTGLLHALQGSGELFKKKNADYVVVVGVDSFLRQEVVMAYMEQRRVLTKDNSNGFIPGEAACAVLIRPMVSPVSQNLQVVGWGEGTEVGLISGNKPLTGDGLTEALRKALGQSNRKMADTDFWLTDQNAEHYKAKECTIAQIRLERREHPAASPYQVWHPIEFLGEIGSAIGPCLLGLGLEAMRQGWGPGRCALMHVGEDNGTRVGLVLLMGQKE